MSSIEKRVREIWLRLPKVALGAMIVTVMLAERYSRMYYRNMVDDAMTSIQYAKQLALGNGVVFNVGERVEGYTNFLWVVFMAPIYAVSRALGVEFVHVMIHVNVLIAAGVTLLVYLLAARLWGAKHLSTLLAVGLCLVDNSFTVWAALGLEVHFLALWMLLALWLARTATRRRALYTGLALLAAHLTRPDAGLFCAVVVGNELFEALVALYRRDRVSAKRGLFDALVMGGAWALPFAAYFAWRYDYYGALFPNTYYLKLEGEIDAWARGIEYLRSFLDVRAFVPVLGLLSVFALGDKTIRTLFVYVGLHMFYVTYVGGDFFPGHRFYVPEIPQFALLVGASVDVLWRFARSDRGKALFERAGLTSQSVAGFGFAAGSVALVVVWFRGVEMGPIQGEVITWRDNLRAHRRLLQWVAKTKPEGASFATCLIGHTGYYSETRVIDVCGVLDPEVARRHVANFGKGQAGHEKIAQPDYIFKKQPTYVGLHVLHGDLWRRGYFLDANIPKDTFEGLWVRDLLPEQGQYLEDTRIRFERGESMDWTKTGDAFFEFPSYRNHRGQGQIIGAWGGFANSFHPTLANQPTGNLRTTPFELRGDRLVFRMAGGRDPERLTVNLWIDERRVFTTTGNQGDMMSRRSWDIRPYRGKRAVFEIDDRKSEAWGYLAVDEIAQWVAGSH
jgi:hypothetical protein